LSRGAWGGLWSPRTFLSGGIWNRKRKESSTTDGGGICRGRTGPSSLYRVETVDKGGFSGNRKHRREWNAEVRLLGREGTKTQCRVSKMYDGESEETERRQGKGGEDM